MKHFFLKIPVELPKQPSPREKHQSLLNAIGGGWYVNKVGQKHPPLKKRKLTKNPKIRGGNKKKNLQG